MKQVVKKYKKFQKSKIKSVYLEKNFFDFLKNYFLTLRNFASARLPGLRQCSRPASVFIAVRRRL